MASGIYQIKNTLNGKCYIGSAVNLKKRWVIHLHYLRHNTHYNSHLQSAFNKYGEFAFVFETLEEPVEPKSLIEREQHYLDTLKPKYNISPTAGSLLGYRHSAGVMQKRSAMMRGKPHPHKGHHLSEETKRKISIARMGQHPSEETLAKLRAAKIGVRNHNYGKRFSEETRRKMSVAKIAYWRKKYKLNLVEG